MKRRIYPPGFWNIIEKEKAMENFEHELQVLINKYNWDTSLNMPDFLISALVVSNLNNLKTTLDQTEAWRSS